MLKSDLIYMLLVDDLEENLLSLEALLRQDGVVLLKATSGLQALELLLKYDIALALLDVQMPGMDGFELAELMRGNIRTGHIPIIFLTAGSADRQRRFRGYEAGAVDFLAKPLEADILRSKVTIFLELKRQKNLIIQQRDELHSIVEENRRLLSESLKYASALQEADQRKDEFLATLAHELRNPLAPIKNGLEILRLQPDTQEAGNLRDMMSRQLNHLVHLIDDLLDVSRISQGKIELRKEPITLQSALKAAIETSHPYIIAGEHKLHCEIAEESLWVEADFTRLAQIVSNLLNNAAKYTPNGGSITLSVYNENKQAIISVSDNGIGIEAAMLPKVFNLFEQAHDKHGRTQDGLGIGLALVQNLTDMHGGKLHVESEGLGKGSCFTVALPLTDAPAQTNQSDKPYTYTDTLDDKLNILVVDDNISSAQTIGWMLEIMGHSSVLAHSGEEALSVADNIVPDAILLDIGLPDRNGYEICSDIRKDARFAKTLIIAQTGWGQERDKQLAREAGFDHHMVKPIELKELSQVLGNYSKEVL